LVFVADQPGGPGFSVNADQPLAGSWAPANSMIEYRFFRVSWPEGALLVDFIWRRRAASAEVRVSCFQNGVAAVHRSVEEREPDLPNTGPIGGCRLDQHASTGSVGPV